MITNRKIEKYLSSARINAYRQFLLNLGIKEDEIDCKIRELYIWNIQTSSAFLEFFSFYEVALRNAILFCVEHIHRYSLLDSRFIQSLPLKHRTNLLNIINDISGENYEYQHNRPLKIDTSKVNINTVIAKLNFHFWEFLLSSSYSSRYLTHHYRKSFKNAKSALKIKQIHRITAEIRELRNRVCHNEPIFKKPYLKRLYFKALIVLKLIDEELSVFVALNTGRLNEELNRKWY